MPPAAPPTPDQPASSRPTPAHGIPSVVRRVTLSSEGPGPGLPPPTSKTDTGEVSIWEMFGVKRPSDLDSEALDNLVREVQAKETVSSQDDFTATLLPRKLGRVRPARAGMGLRLRLALHAARVRRRLAWNAR